MNIESIVFENNTLRIINQKELPQTFKYITLSTLSGVIDAIKSLKVRGAPAIGILAAYGMYKHAESLYSTNQLNINNLTQAADALKSSRPTAVNLGWAVDKMMKAFLKYSTSSIDDVLLSKLKETAVNIHLNDKNTCASIGKYGAELIKDGSNILTHCNAGILATGGRGTALSIIYEAKEQGKNIHLYVDETRPVGQGARLTYWELMKNNIPATLIADNMAAGLMQLNKIDAVIVGADRIAKNGDTANKIGTYSLAVLAHYHQIPFYVAAPLSTFDFSIEGGGEI
ncbi:MAG: S-methyl-5-thioribose-1-phosphate isomerase, partial [Calditrichales bacterium]|nr:S-methyl-5-thioribose-1-phosphate isomerase [Calditrichales bacterium]